MTTWVHTPAPPAGRAIAWPVTVLRYGDGAEQRVLEGGSPYGMLDWRFLADDAVHLTVRSAYTAALGQIREVADHHTHQVGPYRFPLQATFGVAGGRIPVPMAAPLESTSLTAVYSTAFNVPVESVTYPNSFLDPVPGIPNTTTFPGSIPPPAAYTLVLSAWHPWGTVDKRSEIGVAHSRGHAYAIPAVFERGTWIDRVGVQLMSSDANLVIRAALYWPSRADVTSFDAYPGVFYRDLGCSQIASGWNVFSLSEPVYVQPGFWWLVFVGCGNATSYRVREHYTLPVLGLGRTAGDALTPITQVRMGWLETGINSFPPTFPHTHAFLNAPYQDDERLAGWTYYPLSVADVSCGTPPVSSPPPPNTPTPPPAPPFASDSTWHAFGWADQRGATGFGYARGGVYGWPAIFERTTLVDAFGVAALDTSSMAMRLGIYHPTIADARSFDAFPGELHVDAGCRADVQSGFYVFSLGAPAVFSPGLYWLIMVGCGPDTGVTLKLGGPLTTLGMQDNLEPVTGLRMTRFLTGIDSLPTTFPHTPQFLNNAFGQGADPAQWYYRPSSIMG